ncbi:36398_t:CDS:2, partial [Racocetra persica]
MSTYTIASLEEVYNPASSLEEEYELICLASPSKEEHIFTCVSDLPEENVFTCVIGSSEGEN